MSRPAKQQRILAHWARTFKTVTAVGHATQSAVLGATAGAGGFEPVIGHVVVNEIFHLGFPFRFAAVDVLLSAVDSLLLRDEDHRSPHDVVSVEAVLLRAVLFGTNSSWHPPILLIHHVLVHAITSTTEGTQGPAIVHGGLIVLPRHHSSIGVRHYGVLIGRERRIESHETQH
jgi:hypothetical protein